MTYIYGILRDGPVGLWSLDSLSGSVFTDSSGYDRDATKTGTPTVDKPIVAGGISAQYLSSTAKISYPLDQIMIQGRETWPFSLEAWIKPQSLTSSMAPIIARDSSGLFVDGTTIKFVIDMSTAFTAVFDSIKAGETYHVVGTFDGISIRLFVNGIEVANEIIITDIFIDTTATLSTSVTTGFTMVVDTVAVYNYAIGNSIIQRHYSDGIAYPDIISMGMFNGAKYFEFYDEVTTLLSNSEFSSDDKWNSGLFSGDIASIDDSLVNLYDETTLQFEDGVWSLPISFEPLASTSISSSKINWDSVGDVTVEYSTDGTTFIAVNQNESIADLVDISAGFSVEVRITFPESPTQIQLNRLYIAFYLSKDVRGSDESVTATVASPLAAVLSDSSYIPTQFDDNDGIFTSAGITIPHDDGINYSAVEMSVFIPDMTASKTLLYVNSTSSQPSITINGSNQLVFANTTAVYVDGVAATSPLTLDAGKWHHIIAVFAGSVSDVIVGNNAAGSAGVQIRLAYLSLYQNPLTSQDAISIYDSWVGAPAVQIQEDDISDINEFIFAATGQAFRAYSYDWSITGAG